MYKEGTKHPHCFSYCKYTQHYHARWVKHQLAIQDLCCAPPWQTPATCNQFSASVIHDVWIWLVSQRSKLPLIMAAVVEGLLQHSGVKSNRNNSNLLHVKMFAAARLDYMVLNRKSHRCILSMGLSTWNHKWVSCRSGSQLSVCIHLGALHGVWFVANLILIVWCSHVSSVSSFWVWWTNQMKKYAPRDEQERAQRFLTCKVTQSLFFCMNSSSCNPVRKDKLHSIHTFITNYRHDVSNKKK